MPGQEASMRASGSGYVTPGEWPELHFAFQIDTTLRCPESLVIHGLQQFTISFNRTAVMTFLTDEINAAAVKAWMDERPRPKTEAFDRLVQELNGDMLMAEMMWIYWGDSALKYLDWEKPEFNQHLRWWKFNQKKNTIRSLIQEPEGKQWVWRMLHDAGTWL